MSIKQITVRGARQHNLKNINVEIPRDKFTVKTELFGSGKFNSDFEVIFAMLTPPFGLKPRLAARH
ncbi:MAG TPA: hypothetical protein VK892_14265 [Pyrinomonadaceae bacterium]|nr:hypothetical protein [Pyrinomonadaceae bacterium]